MKGTNVATMAGDGASRRTELQGKRVKDALGSLPDKAERKAHVRRVFGRVGWEDVGSGRFRFELTKAGLVVHRKACRKKGDDLIPFDRLTCGAGHEFDDNGTKVRFSLSVNGVEVRRGGSKMVKVVGFAQLADLGRIQPELPL